MSKKIYKEKDLEELQIIDINSIVDKRYRPRNNLTGNVFGKLTVVGYLGKSEWLCKCSCGNFIKCKTNRLTDKKSPTKSCGCLHQESVSKNIAGQRFGKLVATRRVEFDATGRAIWEFKCDCGNIITKEIRDVTVHRLSSCGCLQKVDLAGRKFSRLTGAVACLHKNQH